MKNNLFFSILILGASTLSYAMQPSPPADANGPIPCGTNQDCITIGGETTIRTYDPKLELKDICSQFFVQKYLLAQKNIGFTALIAPCNNLVDNTAPADLHALRNEMRLMMGSMRNTLIPKEAEDALNELRKKYIPEVTSVPEIKKGAY